MKRHLPPRPSVEQAHKQAKDLLGAYKAGDSDAHARVRQNHPRFQAGERQLALNDAQWVIAREHGFESWPKLIHHIEGIASVQHDVASFDPARLVELLAVKDWRIRISVREHLKATLDESMEAVLAGIRHPNPKVRRLCAELMDHGGDDRCIEPLRAALRDSVPRVRRAAMHSLVCQRCKAQPLHYEAVPDLIDRSTNDPATRVRLIAIDGMRQHLDPRLVDVLEHVLSEEREPRLLRVAEGVLRIQLRALQLEDIIERALQGATLPVRKAAVKVLAEQAPDAQAAEALELVLRRETDPVLMRCAERALKIHTSATAPLGEGR